MDSALPLWCGTMAIVKKGIYPDSGGGCAAANKGAETKSVSVQVDRSVFGLHLAEGVYEIKRMESRRSRLRSVILICMVLAVAGIVGFGYFCNDQVRIGFPHSLHLQKTKDEKEVKADGISSPPVL